MRVFNRGQGAQWTHPFAAGGRSCGASTFSSSRFAKARRHTVHAWIKNRTDRRGDCATTGVRPGARHTLRCTKRLAQRVCAGGRMASGAKLCAWLGVAGTCVGTWLKSVAAGSSMDWRKAWGRLVAWGRSCCTRMQRGGEQGVRRGADRAKGAEGITAGCIKGLYGGVGSTTCVFSHNLFIPNATPQDSQLSHHSQ